MSGKKMGQKLSDLTGDTDDHNVAEAWRLGINIPSPLIHPARQVFSSTLLFLFPFHLPNTLFVCSPHFWAFFSAEMLSYQS